jgi:hypothetical protein
MFHLGKIILGSVVRSKQKSSGGALATGNAMPREQIPAPALFIPKPYIVGTIIDAIRTFEKM